MCVCVCVCVYSTGKSSKPWRETASHVKETLRWKSSAESLVVFLVRGRLVFSLFLSFFYVVPQQLSLYLVLFLTTEATS